VAEADPPAPASDRGAADSAAPAADEESPTADAVSSAGLGLGAPVPGSKTAAGDGTGKRPSSRRTPAAATARVAQATKPQPEKINPGEVFKIGFQAWARGDTKTALASYKRVLATNPDYAPAWRGVGLVYEKLGDKPGAHNAFQKYLQLEPSATDAASIRARLEAL
ncbi:MAG TPA: tetratricopeptide repeat protein, partial [Kofleriaceae bacterium]|nr:tetratricopeptide repeat protein [Kofleriaceae bacterium]